MKTFEEFRSDFISKSKNAGACEGEYKRLLQSETKESVIAVIKDNIRWIFNNSVLNSADLLEGFTKEELNSFHIYTSGDNSVVARNNEILNIITLGSSQATV